MKKIADRSEVLLILVIFVLSRLIIQAFGIQMDYGALLRNWQYLDTTTLRTDLLKGVWYDHTQPPIFNLFLGLILKTFGTGARMAFVFLFKAFTLLNTFLLLSILKRVTRHPWLPLAFALLYLLSPAAIIFENELFYTSFITLLLLIAVRYLLSLDEKITRSRIAGLFIPLILVCLTRSMYHLVLLLILSALVWFFHRKKQGSKTLLLGATLSLLLVSSWYVKNFFVFHTFSTSTWMGMNMARNVFHDATVTDSSQIAAIEPFSKISTYQPFLPHGYGSQYAGLEDRDLMQEYKNDSFINEKHIGYIEVSRRYTEECKKAIKSHPAAYLKNVAQSAIIFFAPATRYPTTEYLSEKMAWYDLLYSFNLSHFAHGKQQRRIALTLSAIPKFFIYLLVFFWLTRETIHHIKVRKTGSRNNVTRFPDRSNDGPSANEPVVRSGIPGGLLTLFITLIIGYIFAVSSLFEHYENMRFRYEAEPLFLILAAIALSAIKSRKHPLSSLS